MIPGGNNLTNFFW